MDKLPWFPKLKQALRELLKPSFNKLPADHRLRIIRLAARSPFLRKLLTSSDLQKFHGDFYGGPGQAKGALLDISQIPVNFTGVPGKVAVHCHVYYSDLIDEFAHHLSVVPFQFDAFISVATDEARELCESKLGGIKTIKLLKVAKVPNRGRDIAPMFCKFGKELNTYDYVAHLHGKKSLYNDGSTMGWREYLFDAMFGSTKNVKRIFSLFRDIPKLGIVYPQAFRLLPYTAYCWLANRENGARLCHLLNIPFPNGYFDYPAGSMFWARVDAIRPLFELKLRWKDFPEECGQTDGTLAHTIERLLGIIPTSSGYRSCILKDMGSPSWSSYRLDQQYLTRHKNYYHEMIAGENVRLVAFDIFDTLLTRPLLNPDNTKVLIKRRLGKELQSAFESFRAVAETKARSKHGRDIGIGEIYDEFQVLTGLSASQVSQVRELEERLELASVSACREVVELFDFARESGKRVVLISDMFLPVDVINEMLTSNDIVGWDRLYLSSVEGCRKDDGQLYKRLLEFEKVSGEQVVMIGDNERSDFQLPSEEFAIQSIHLLSAPHLASALPHYRWFVSPQFLADSLDRELSVALLVQENLNKIARFDQSDIDLFGKDPYRLGFNLLGPLLTGFCAWLLNTALKDKTEKLCFLSREGKLIKAIYDIWSTTVPDAPRSCYLQLSRRVVTVPRIKTIDDVLAIASDRFFPNSINVFLFERYGLELSDEKWQQIHDAGVWKKGRLLEIKSGDLHAVEPLLRFVFDDICLRRNKEKPALMRYLKEMELANSGKAAVVDIGFSGTIQKSLNQLLEKSIHGYYLATSESIREGIPEDVITESLFVKEAIPQFDDSRILTHSFALEKLLSANDPQINFYQETGEGALEQVFKELRQGELESAKVRDPLQQGALDYVLKAVHVQQTLFRDFQPDGLVADNLFTAFIEYNDRKKSPVLDGLILDDDYCGRELV